jgi:hypothetical protein
MTDAVEVCPTCDIAGCHHIRAKRAETVTISRADYERLLDASECDPTIIRCDLCNGWTDHLDPGLCSVESEAFYCWWSALGREKDRETCWRDKRPGRVDKAERGEG